MATKWKKSKTIFGFFSFALGVSLLLTSLLPLAGSMMSESGRDRLKNTLQSDFQQTESFRDYLSRLMNTFLAMGAGGPVNGDYYSYGDEYALAVEGVAETVILQQDVGWYIDSGSVVGKPTEATRAQWKKEAEAYHQAIQGDKNILYCIQNGDTVLYTNIDDADYYHAAPSGYDTVLTFQNGKCTLAIAGEQVSIYGENGQSLYVDDGEHWYLPGYVNFPAGKETEDVSVFIAVADVPALYLQPNYASNWSRWQYNRLYQLEQNWQSRRSALMSGAIQMAVGLLLLFIWFPLRREKSLADRAIAGMTGRIWFECKLLLLLAALVFLVLPLTENMRYLFQEMTFAVAMEDGVYYQAPWFLTEYIQEVAHRPGAILPAFWTLYLFLNDLHYGDKPWRHGLLGLLRAKGLRLPVQKRFSRQCGWMGLSLLLVGAELIFFLILATVQNSLPRWSIWNLFLLPLLLSLVIYLVTARRFLTLAKDLGLLTDQITAVHNGDLTSGLLPADSDLGKASQEVADIQQGMARAVAEQTRSERMKVELVTNVSHDIKTPLTSIISYAELLKQEQLAPPAGEYVDILSQKAERLRAMVLDVFEVSKAASGDLPVKLEPLDLAKLLRQTVADMAEVIETAPVTLRQSLPEEPVTIVADGDRLYRVFQNLLQNALGYALEGSRVYLTLGIEDGKAVVSVKNTSKTELPGGVDFTARFVRGDPSRTDGGSGLGLAIAESFTAACGGILRVEPVADLFVVTVEFPLAPDYDSSPAVMDAEIAE